MTSMNNTLVIPFCEELIKKLHKRSLLVETDNVSNIIRIRDIVYFNNYLSGIKIMRPSASLSEVEYIKEWSNIPLIFYYRNIGDLFSILSKIDIIRQLDVIFMLSSSAIENYSGLKILSSLKIRCGLFFDGNVDEDLFSDLATYSFLSPIQHADIEPFDYILKNLYGNKRIEIESLYHNSPNQYLHIDEQENIALTKEKLISTDFISQGIDTLNTISWDDLINYKMEHFYSHFINLDKCACCSSMKICGGFFLDKLINCSTILSDIYEDAELCHQKNYNKKK